MRVYILIALLIVFGGLSNYIVAQDRQSSTSEKKQLQDVSKSSDSLIICKLGDLTRKIELLVEDDVTKLPCKVIYTKETEAPNQPQVLWNAQNDYSYCETKFKEFKSKLETFGWKCN